MPKPKLTRMLRDLHQLRVDVQAELLRMQLESPEQLAALCVESFEDGFTTGMNRVKRSGPEPAPKKLAKAKARKRKAKKAASPNPKREALRIHRKIREQLVEVLGDKELDRARLVKRTGLAPELITQCLTKERGVWFVTTPGHRWRVKPGAVKHQAKLSKTRQKSRKAVAHGQRPTMRDLVSGVMGKDVMSPGGIVERLQAKGEMPESRDPKQYINYTLCHYTDRFKRVSRGKYQVVNA